MRLLLYSFVFLISYGSLYPFSFESTSINEALQSPLFNFRLGNSGRGDMIANILLFVPFGFLALHSYPSNKALLRTIQILFVAFILAYLLQVLQLFVPRRTPSGSDAIWNLLGCLMGCALARLPLQKYQRVLSGPDDLPQIALLLSLLLLLYNLAPFVPSLDLQLLKNNLKSILSVDIQPWWLLHKVLIWLVIFHFLSESRGPLARQRYFPLIVLVTLFGSLFIVGHPTSAEHVVGAVVSIPLWHLIRQRERPLALALALGLVILATTFVPFELRDQARSFQWLPFGGALGGNLLLNVMSIFNKIIVYGSLIWLLFEAGFRLRTATVLIAVILLISELLQVFFFGPTAEITDPLLALAIGLAFHCYEQYRQAHIQEGGQAGGLPPVVS